MAVPTPPQTLWSSGDEGTPNRLNWTMLQADTLGNRPAAHADINGVVYLSTSEMSPVLYQVQSGSWVALSSIGVDSVVLKTADQTVNNSETYVNDTHLVFAVGTNEVWSFDMKLLTDSGTTPDFKATFTVPTDTELEGLATFNDTIGNRVHQSFGLSGSTAAATMDIGGIGGGGGDDEGRLVLVFNAIVISHGTAGNVQFRWAQETADSSDTIVKKNSMIIKRRIA